MLHYFNPGHETAVLNKSPYYTLPANPLKMQQDLEFLPAWYAAQDDFIWIENPLPETFIQNVTKHFQRLPKTLIINDLNNSSFQSKKTEAMPWGISPQSIHFFKQLNTQYNLDVQVPEWTDYYHKLCSRRTARECLQTLINTIPEISSEILPEFYSELEIIKQEISKKQDTHLLIKAPYSSSGRGLLWIDPSEMSNSTQQILQGMLKKQHEISLEKALKKQTDFAMLFHSNKDGSVDFRGYSLFQTDTKGNYKGNFICPQNQMISKITDSLDILLLEKVKQCLIHYFSKHIAPYYKGCICVDMMLYCENNKICLHPCVEINLRYSMGWLALYLFRNYFEENASGHFQIDFHKQPGEAIIKHQEMQSDHPLVLKDGKIANGYMPLCPVTDKTNYHAYVVA